MNREKMIENQKVVVKDPIPQIKFACNTSVCQGACCTLPGGQGAPLLDEELVLIEQAFPIVKSYLPQQHIETIKQFGLFEGEPKAYTTMCIDNQACVFVFYDRGIARCAFEKAFLDGQLSWRKPLSCHLFPIRIDRGGITLQIRYERIAECASALTKGEQENIYLSTFLKEPLIRTFGSSWYEEFQSKCSREQKGSKVSQEFVKK
jgi:hypothetical protein